MAFSHYRTRGFIIKKENLREADQLFTIYTEDFGKLEILGKAIRKITSKLRAGSELFYLSEIEFIQGKTYKTLTDVIAIEKFKDLRQNSARLEIAEKICEALDNLILREEKDENIWNLLMEILNRLKNEEPLELNYYYFLWNLFSLLGYQIDLYNCAICQKKLLPEKIYFNFDDGGIIDYNCLEKSQGGTEIFPEAVKVLRLFQKKDWQTLSKLKINNFYFDSLKLISDNCLLHHSQVKENII